MSGYNYKQRIIHQTRGNLIQYLPLDEHSGGVANDASSEGNDGAYSGVGLNNTPGPDGRGAGFYGGDGDFTNLETPGFEIDFDGTEGSLIVWAKVNAAGIWTDSTNRRIVYIKSDNNQNNISIFRSPTNNVITFHYQANNVSHSSTFNTGGETGWMGFGQTWSDSGNFVKRYYMGSEIDNDVMNETWNDVDLKTGNQILGALGTGGPNPWHGWIAHSVICNAPLSQSVMEILTRQ